MSYNQCACLPSVVGRSILYLDRTLSVVIWWEYRTYLGQFNTAPKVICICDHYLKMFEIAIMNCIKIYTLKG